MSDNPQPKVDLTVITCERTAQLPSHGRILADMPQKGVVYVYRGKTPIGGHPWRVIMEAR